MTEFWYVVALGCTVLVVLGGLIGHSLSEHLRGQQIRRQAAAQREIGEQWRALREARTARGRGGRCPRCGANCR